MQKDSPKKQIFNTQPHINLSPYQQFLKEVKSYTQNLNHHLTDAFNDQNKSIKRKRIQLQKQLDDLRDRHFNQRKRIREMEEYFAKNCQDVLKNDISKWQQNQMFFTQMFEHYQYQLEIQTLINQRNRQKITLLKQQLKQQIKDELKSAVSQQLEVKHLSKSKNFRSKKSISLKQPSQMSKLKTESSQVTHQNDFREINFSKVLKRHTETDEKEMDHLPCVSEKIIRVRTQVSLPSLKQSIFLDPDRIKNDDFNFMRPIKTIKKGVKQTSILPQMIKLLKQHHHKVEQNEVQIDWFQKVVFNNRNLSKIIDHLQQEFQQVSGVKKNELSSNKVKDVVAKNLFRLKTQSTIDTAINKSDKKPRKIFYTNDKKSITQRFMG